MIPKKCVTIYLKKKAVGSRIIKENMKMKKQVVKRMLMVVRKEAVKGADAASPKGLFEQKVPNALVKKGEVKS